MLSSALSVHDSPLAAELFTKLTSEEPFVRLVLGPSDVTLDTMCLWEAADCAEIETLRKARLDGAKNDHDLAQQVLTALRQGKADVVQSYAESKLQSSVPADVARGLTVLGFLDASEEAGHALKRHQQIKGFIGDAAKSAQAAYARNQWARHWLELMATATTGEEFWRASVQFLKIIDGRVWLWAKSIKRGEIAGRFEPLLQSAMERRIKHWVGKREKTLFGGKLPSEVYIVQS